MLGPTIDYKSKREIKSKYRLDQVTQQISGASVTLSAAGGNSSIFELVAQPIISLF